VPKWTTELQALGVKIIPIPDKSLFIERMKPVWTQFEKQIGKDLIEEAASTK
jgi:TRAP-type C4-dicarboxylate transport system substrate-binding protein